MSLVDALLLDPYFPYGWASGIPMYGADLFKPAYSFQQVLIQRNIIRNLNDASASATRAIEVAGAEKALVENNIIGVDRARSIEHQSNTKSLTTFNNTKPDGNLIKSLLQTSNDTAPEVITKVRTELEDAIITSFLAL